MDYSTYKVTNVATDLVWEMPIGKQQETSIPCFL